MNNSSENDKVFASFVCFLNVEFTTVGLLELIILIGELKIVQKVFEKTNTIQSFIWDSEDGTHHLWLHLSIDKNNISCIVNNVGNFIADFPKLCS